MNLKILRTLHNYSQKEIANILNCQQNTYSQYETYSRNIPIEALKILAEFYETSIDFLVDFTDEPASYPHKK